MPVLSQSDQILLAVSNSTAAQLVAMGTGRYPFPTAPLIRQASSDRLILAGEHLRAGDEALLAQHFRSSISRHYYAMYHAARAVVFAVTAGDDHERHNRLPRNLPANLANQAQRENELTAARLLRNEADYDPYPSSGADWEQDARSLSVTAADFVHGCEDHCLSNGLI